MDYSKLSDETLKQIASGQPLAYDKLNDDELKELASSSPKEDEHKEEPSTLHDAGMGAVQGMTLGGADELGGAEQAGLNMGMSALHNMMPSLVGKSPTQVNAALKAMGVKGNIGPTTNTEEYRKGQKETEADFDAAKGRSPLAYGAGELGGGIASGIASGGVLPEIAGAKTVAALDAIPGVQPWLAKAGASAINAAPIGAAFGALGSKGNLIGSTPEEKQQLLADTGKGAATGSALGLGLSALGSGIKAGAGALADTQIGQRIGQAFKMGQEGADLGSNTSQLGTLEDPASLQNPLSLHDTSAAAKMVTEFNNADEHLGQLVGETVDGATKQGMVIKADPLLTKKMNSTFRDIENVDLPEDTGTEPEASVDEQSAAPSEESAVNPTFKDFSVLANKLQTEGLTPIELQQFRNDLGDYGRKLYMKDQIASSQAFGLTSDLTNLLRKQVPGYADAATRLNEFRQFVPETILSKDNPQDITALRASGIKNVDTKLLNNLKGMVRNLYNPDSNQARGSYSNLLQGIQKLAQNENTRKAAAQAAGKDFKTVFDQIGYQPQDIENFLKQSAFKSNVIQRYSGGLSMAEPIKLTDKVVGKVANKAGLARQTANNSNPILDTSKKLYASSDPALKGLSSRIRDLPGQKGMADALDRAIDNKDVAAKNAILFSMMQNPNLRTVIDSDNLTLQPGE